MFIGNLFLVYVKMWEDVSLYCFFCASRSIRRSTYLNLSSLKYVGSEYTLNLSELLTSYM